MDEADRADKRIEERISDGINEASRFVASMSSGESGDCEFCGDHFSRLVLGACGFCRDKYDIP